MFLKSTLIYCSILYCFYLKHNVKEKNRIRVQLAVTFYRLTLFYASLFRMPWENCSLALDLPRIWAAKYPIYDFPGRTKLLNLSRRNRIQTSDTFATREKGFRKPVRFAQDCNRGIKFEEFLLSKKTARKKRSYDLFSEEV